jgi:oligopeptide transport system substrate-binding protein
MVFPRRIFALLGCGGLILLANAAIPVRAADAPKILHVGVLGDPQSLDPQLLTGIPEARINRALNEGLVRTDADLKVVPALAQSWEVSSDGLIYTFHLRPEARWSHGRAVTAQDFVRSYQRLLTPALGAEYADNAHPIAGAEDFQRGRITDFTQTGVKALDDHTLQLRLHQPASFFLYYLTRPEFSPVPLDVVEKYGTVYGLGNRWTNEGNYVGTGPFVLTSARNGQKIVVARSPTYWDRAHVKLDEIHFYPISNPSDEERMFRAGQLHITQTVPLNKIAAYRNKPSTELHIDPYGGLYYYLFNVKRAPFDDVRVRQAFALAIDRETLVARVTLAGEKPAYHAVPPGLQGYESTATFQADVETARQLLAAAGFAGGKGLPAIELLYNTQDNHRAIAEAIQQMWHKNLGADVTLVNQEWKVYLDVLAKTHAFQVARAGWITGEPHDHLERWTTGNMSNYAQWSSAAYDRLLQAALAAPTDAGRYDCYRQMEKILNDEMPICPIYFYTTPRLISSKVLGFRTTLDDSFPWKEVDLAP